LGWAAAGTIESPGRQLARRHGFRPRSSSGGPIWAGMKLKKSFASKFNSLASPAANTFKSVKNTERSTKRPIGMPANKKKSFERWLEKLQEQSWNLELIVSGFALVLLMELNAPLENWSARINLLTPGEGGSAFWELSKIVLFLRVGWLFMMVNLSIHIILRGLWIGTIGLRYVSGKINYHYLNFSDRFYRFLKRKVGDYDDYIEGLEKICSVIYAFSFLIFFMWISIGSTLAILMVGFGLLREYTGDFPAALFLLFSLLGGLLYFIDFFTLGGIKKIKWRWVSAIYFPIYRFFSITSLSFLYRPLYYNFIDQKFGRRLAWMILPYLAAVVTISETSIVGHSYFPSAFGTIREGNLLEWNYYDDLRKESDPVYFFSIPSKYIDGDYLELFLLYEPDDDPTISELCPSLKKTKKRGLSQDLFGAGLDEKAQVWINDTAFAGPEIRRTTYVYNECFQQQYDIYLDTALLENYETTFFIHPALKQKGLLAMIDISELDRGKHELQVIKKRAPKDAAGNFLLKKAVIPFWK
jgi:hypothetical protein